MMGKKLLIDAVHPEETRIAVVNGSVVEFYDFEITSMKSKKGNIYLGKVMRVEPSLQAAFVDYGEERQGFLPLNEIHPQYWCGDKDHHRSPQKVDRKSKRIENILKINQFLPIQVLKDAHKTKGAFLTTYISFSGRYCILMPNSGHRTGGVSRRIEMQDRTRLKKILLEFGLPEGMAVILRSAVEDKKKNEIRRDLDCLMSIWREVYAAAQHKSEIMTLHLECTMVHRALRDIHDRDIDEIIISGQEAYKSAKAYMKKLIPSHVSKIRLHRENQNIFSSFDVDAQIQDIFKQTVTLPSGGSIVISTTEALVSIDVNSGKTKEKTLDETSLTANLEAADAIALHVKLRNLSGIIVVDFIDMNQQEHIENVEKKLKAALKEDRAKIEVGKIGEFGLLEFSRQRKKPSLYENYFQKCLYCNGSGRVRAKESVALSILRNLEEILEKNTKIKKIIISTYEGIDMFLLNEKRDHIILLEKKFSCTIFIVRKRDFDGDAFDVVYEQH